MNSFSRVFATLMVTSFLSSTTLGQTMFSQSQHRRRLGDSNSLSSSPERERQAQASVFFHFTEETLSPAPTPQTPPPTLEPNERTPNYRSCGRQNTGNNYVVPLDVMYDVETDVEDLSVELEQKMLGSLSGAMIASVFDSHCGERRKSSRKLELESIDAGQMDIPLDPCTAQGTDSKGCMRYDGDLSLGYNDVGEASTALAVGRMVIVQIKDDMDNGRYIEKLNADLIGSGVSVTRVNYVGSNYLEWLKEEADSEQPVSAIQTSNFTVDDGGLNGLGKYMVAFVSLLLLLAICACGCLALTRARKAEARQDEQEQKREIATIVSDEGNDIEYDESNLSADYPPLPANSTIDVHRCISSECNVCQRNLAPVRTTLSSVASNMSSSVSNLSGEDCKETTEIKPLQTGSRSVRRINPDGSIDDIIQMGHARKPKQKVRFPSNQDVWRRSLVVDDTGELREEVEL